MFFGNYEMYKYELLLEGVEFLFCEMKFLIGFLLIYWFELKIFRRVYEKVIVCMDCVVYLEKDGFMILRIFFVFYYLYDISKMFGWLEKGIFFLLNWFF